MIEMLYGICQYEHGPVVAVGFYDVLNEIRIKAVSVKVCRDTRLNVVYTGDVFTV